MKNPKNKMSKPLLGAGRDCVRNLDQKEQYMPAN